MPKFASVMDVVSATIGIEPLREVSLSNGQREFRVWINPGPAVPGRMLRIIESPDTVQGELIYWLSTPQPTDDRMFRAIYGMMIKTAGRTGCQNLLPNQAWSGQNADDYALPDWMMTCKVDYGAVEPNWGNVLARLLEAEVFAFSETATLEREAALKLDGAPLTVEVSNGATYRTYRYDDPEVQRRLDPAFADSLVDLITALGPIR